MPEGTTRAKGMNGEVLFDGRFVTIRHNWTAPGGRGESRYPLSAVVGAEYKPGVITAVFTLVVAVLGQPGAVKEQRNLDPFTVEGSVKHREGFMAMRDRIMLAIADRGPAVPMPAPAPIPAPGSEPPPDPGAPGAPTAMGLVAQLQQLAALHSSGALTAEEFSAAKAQVLGVRPAPQDAPPAQW